MRLADFWTGRHDARREFEWKVTLGLWAVILGGISYHEKLGWPRLLCLPLLPVASAVVFVLYYRLWLRPLWVRNMKDRDQGFRALEEAKKVLQDDKYVPILHDHNVVDISWHRFVKDWAMVFQAAATALLLTLFALIAWSP